MLRTLLKVCLQDTVDQLFKELGTGQGRVDIPSNIRVKGKLEREITRMGIDRPPSLHLTLMRGIRYIKKMDWVIKEADKNLGLTLMSREFYDGLVQKEIHEGAFSEVSAFPLGSLLGNLLVILEVCQKGRKFNDEILHYAQGAKDPAPFYVLPKIHKPTVKSRPITASHSYITADLSRKLSTILNELVLKIPAISVNSWQTVRQLEQIRLPTDCVFLTYDVERCYPSIDIKDAIRLLTKEQPKIFMADNGFWCRVLQFIMYNNYVTDGHGVHRQLVGTATGTAVAPAFANLYLFYKFRRIFKDFVSSVIINRRYIDDGLVILRNREAADLLMQRLNTCSNLRMTWDISEKKAVYLDLEIYKGRRFFFHNLVDVKVYTKPISKFLYLHGKSNHPTHTFTGVVKGELIRYLRNTTDERTWKAKVAHLFRMLAHRGYTGKYLRAALDYVSYRDRAKYLERAEREPPDLGSLVKCRFHPQMKKYWRQFQAWIECQLPRHGIREKWPRTLLFKKGDSVSRHVISAVPCLKSADFKQRAHGRAGMRNVYRANTRARRNRQIQLYTSYWHDFWKNQKRATQIQRS